MAAPERLILQPSYGRAPGSLHNTMASSLRAPALRRFPGAGRRRPYVLALATPPRKGGPHWSDKIMDESRSGEEQSGAGALAEVPLGGVGGAEAAGLGALSGILRDRDNAVLVGDERLVLPFLAKEMGVPQEEADAACQQLLTLVPPLKGKFRAAKVARLARLCSDLPGVARRMVGLKATVFPMADLGRLISVFPDVLELPVEDLAGRMEWLQGRFPNATGHGGRPTMERMVQAQPLLLDTEFVEVGFEQLGRLLGKDAEGVAEMIMRDPSILLQVEGHGRGSMYSSHKDSLSNEERGHKDNRAQQ
mmetsp:Transcript_6/g.17  ORF Transcript_6/g.17 Transcript_6/m.17 type:complete len:306 (+) Transcript_6:169-1086(+)